MCATWQLLVCPGSGWRASHLSRGGSAWMETALARMRGWAREQGAGLVGEFSLSSWSGDDPLRGLLVETRGCMRQSINCEDDFIIADVNVMSVWMEENRWLINERRSMTLGRVPRRIMKWLSTSPAKLYDKKINSLYYEWCANVLCLFRNLIANHWKKSRHRQLCYDLTKIVSVL